MSCFPPSKLLLRCSCLVGALLSFGTGAFADARVDYPARLRQLDHQVHAAEAATTRRPNDWLPREALAMAALERAQLRGSLDDYLLAESAMAAAYERAPKGAGPHLNAARLHFALHRLDAAQAALDQARAALMLDEPQRAEIEGLAADIALARGEYDRARAGFERALDLRPGFGALVRLALYHAQTAQLATADGLFVAAETYLHAAPQSSAWLELQRGLLDLARGRVSAALRHYQIADRIFPGWWLIEEHMAEAFVLLGETERATGMYRELIARTGDPEFMHALAALTPEAESKLWIEKARAEFARRMQQLPEAMIGHSLAFELAHGLSPAKTIELAARNVALRAGGEAQLQLAQAYAAAGQPESARSILERVLASPYRSPTLDALSAQLSSSPGRSLP